MAKPFSQSCENNQEPIRRVLEQYIQTPSSLLEIGSGTGQHAVYMAARFPELNWQTSDRRQNIAGIQMWLDDAGLANLPKPIELDVTTANPALNHVDYIYSANTLHIMPKSAVESFFDLVGSLLKPSAILFVYGPFNYDGEYTSASNQRFDTWLKQQSAHQGIRDFEWVDKLAQGQQLSLLQDHEMPANNRLLVWRRSP